MAQTKAAQKKIDPALIPVLLIGAAIVAALIGGIQALNHYTARHQNGHSEGSEIFADGDGRAILTIDRVGGNRAFQRRVTAIDARSGQTVTRFFDREGGCAPASPGRIWCEFGFGTADRPWYTTRRDQPLEFGAALDDGVLLLDRSTLATVATLDSLIDGKKLGRRVAGHWKILGGIAWALLDNGQGARVDPATLEVTASDDLPKPFTISADLQEFRELGANKTCGMLAQIPERGAPLFSLTSGQRAAVVLGKTAGSAKFLQPIFLVDSATQQAIFVDGDPVILHLESIPNDKRSVHMLVSRIGKDGSAIWTAPLGGPCERATLTNGVLALTSGYAEPRALGLDAATGKVRWHVEF